MAAPPGDQYNTNYSICSGARAELARNGGQRWMRGVAMASLIAANVFLSSLKWSMTRVHGDKLVMVITKANLLQVKRVAFFIV